MHIASIPTITAALLCGAIAGQAMAQSEPAKRDDRAAQACEDYWRHELAPVFG